MMNSDVLDHTLEDKRKMEVHGVLSYIIRGVDGRRYSFKVRTEIPAAGRVLLLALKSDCEQGLHTTHL